jgi:3-oxoacyl-[acyl-carrier-protein] synthase III
MAAHRPAARLRCCCYSNDHTTPSPAPVPGTCILFGDGCGAVLVSAAPEGQSCSLLGMDMHSDGNGQKSLNAIYSGSGGKPMQVRMCTRDVG